MKPGLHPGFISVTFSIYTNKSFNNITYPKSGNYISFNKKRSILTANTSLLSKKMNCRFNSATSIVSRES